MKIACESCALRKKDCFDPMSPEEVTFMDRFKVGELCVDAGTTILMEGAPSPQLFTVYEGLGLRYKTLEDGRRQVVNFVFPGDLIGLQSAVMGEMCHTTEATTAMRLCVFDRNALWDLFRNQPARAFALTWLGAAEEHFLGEALATVGQRDATERVAWALSRLWHRLGELGMIAKGQAPLPFRQQDLADALGLSLVHTNKTLARLRARGLARWQEGRLTVPDPRALAEAANASPPGGSPRPIL